MQIELIEIGTLEGKKARIPTNAAGRYILESGMHLNSKASIAILDGVVRLKL